jgi:hypothetical protein
MKKLSYLLSFLVLFTAFTCEDEPIDGAIDADAGLGGGSGSIEGTWELVSINYDGTTQATAFGITLDSEYVGNSLNEDYQIVFDNGTATANGSYDIELTVTSFGISQTTTESVVVNNATSNYTISGNTITYDAPIIDTPIDSTIDLGDQSSSAVFSLSNNNNTLTLSQDQTIEFNQDGVESTTTFSLVTILERVE